MADSPISLAEIEGARSRIRTRFWGELSSSRGRAEQLGTFEIGTGDYRHLFSRNDEFNAVTPTDIQRVTQSYLIDRNRVVAIAHPLADDS